MAESQVSDPDSLVIVKGLVVLSILDPGDISPKLGRIKDLV